MGKQKNVIFFTIEALRFDRTCLGNYNRPTTPVLNKLISNSLYCTKTFALAPCTQPSFPTIMTSSRPLSHGGYDLGALNRPLTITEHFQNHGYFTEHLATIPWITPTYGYGKNVSKFSALFSVNMIVKATIFTVRSSLKAYTEGSLAKDEMLTLATPRILNCFNDVEAYCLNSQKNIDQFKCFSGSNFANEELDWEHVKRVVSEHRSRFLNNPVEYILKNLSNLPLNSISPWLVREFCANSKFFELKNLISENVAFRKIRKNFGSRYRAVPANKFFVDGKELADQIIASLKQASQQESPIFLWTHFMDTHLPYQAGQQPDWQKNMSDILAQLGYTPKFNFNSLFKAEPETEQEKQSWSAAYDCCVRYVDTQIGRIVDALQKYDLHENTIIVISGDHGEEIGEHSEFGHRFRFYEECLHVPLIFYSPDFKSKRIDSLTDLMDVAPTLSSLAGLKPDLNWQGSDLSDDYKGKDHLIFECFHRGNCLFVEKPLYIGIRTESHKFIWREWIDNEDESAKFQKELYNLIKDPNERINVYHDEFAVAEKLEAIVFKRLGEIPEYVAARKSLQMPELNKNQF